MWTRFKLCSRNTCQLSGGGVHPWVLASENNAAIFFLTGPEVPRVDASKT